MDPNNNDDDDRRKDEIELQRQVWLKEQLALAKKVKVLLPDDDDDAKTSDNSIIMQHEIDDFLLLPTNALLANQQDNDNKQSKKNNPSSFYYYGGVDVSFPSNPNEEESVAVYVIVDARTMEVIYQDYEYFRITVPYISSFLAFREIDPLQRLIEKQTRLKPELTPRAILVDGNGIFHERRAGLACFVGVRTGIPTIGIGKTLYCHGGLTENLVRYGIDLSLQRAVLNHLDFSLPKTCLKNPTTTMNESSIITESMIFWDFKPIIGSEDDVSTPMDSEVSSEKRGDMIRSLSACCMGLAIPLGARVGEDDNDNAQAEGSSTSMHSPRHDILASVLIGHGGRGSHKRGIKSPGTKVPIFVSVGHEISLQQAVQICAFLSIYKLPEPVRQADLIGRELLRQRKQN